MDCDLLTSASTSTSTMTAAGISTDGQGHLRVIGQHGDVSGLTIESR